MLNIYFKVSLFYATQFCLSDHQTRNLFLIKLQLIWILRDAGKLKKMNSSTDLKYKVGQGFLGLTKQHFMMPFQLSPILKSKFAVIPFLLHKPSIYEIGHSRFLTRGLKIAEKLEK